MTVLGVPLLWVSLYLLAGLLLAEGGRWAQRKNRGTEMPFGAYLLVIGFWPLLIAWIIFEAALGRRTK